MQRRLQVIRGIEIREVLIFNVDEVTRPPGSRE
jgi:hypothetical protein